VEILGDRAGIVLPAEGGFELAGPDDALEAAIEIIARHPMRHEELEAALGEQAPGREAEILASLEASRRVTTVVRSGTRFWCAAGARHAAEGSEGPEAEE
jgi:hypothetical protein